MANFNFNKVILGGRLTAEPELKKTQNEIPVVSFSVAVSRKTRSNANANEVAMQVQQPQQPTADFFNCVAWRSTAEFVSKYFHKGSSICVTGSLQNRSWTDQQGVKRYATEIVVDEVNFVDSKNDNNASTVEKPSGVAQSVTPPTSTQAYSDYPAGNFAELQSDDELPF